MKFTDIALIAVAVVLVWLCVASLSKKLGSECAEAEGRVRLYGAVGRLLDSGADWIDNSYEKPEPEVGIGSIHLHQLGEICYTCLAGEIECYRECCNES